MIFALPYLVAILLYAFGFHAVAFYMLAAVTGAMMVLLVLNVRSALNDVQDSFGDWG